MSTVEFRKNKLKELRNIDSSLNDACAVVENQMLRLHRMGEHDAAQVLSESSNKIIHAMSVVFEDIDK